MATLHKDGKGRLELGLGLLIFFFGVSLTKPTSVNDSRYHVPKSWLKPTGNLLVVFEEWGGDPNGIFLVRRDIDTVCADIYEWQPTLINWQMQASGKVDKPLRPKAHLSCGAGQKISKIKFASFGTPEGACGSFREGSCHAHHSYDAFERVCFLSGFLLFQSYLLLPCCINSKCSIFYL